jgi:hypothetical protein
MADGGLLMIYRAVYTGTLLARRDTLFNSLTSFSSMTVGGKSFQRDIDNNRRHLEAIQFVLNERTCPYEGTVLTDFSDTPMIHARPGDEELMS